MKRLCRRKQGGDRLRRMNPKKVKNELLVDQLLLLMITDKIFIEIIVNTLLCN